MKKSNFPRLTGLQCCALFALPCLFSTLCIQVPNRFEYFRVNSNSFLPSNSFHQISDFEETQPLTLWPSLAIEELKQAIEMEQIKPLPVFEPLIAVLGDSRASLSYLGPSARWPSLMTAIKHERPNVFLHLGDWVQEGESDEQWSQVMKSLLPIKHLPLLTVRGNHDRGKYFEHLGFVPQPASILRVSVVGSILLFLLDSEAEAKQVQSKINLLFDEQTQQLKEPYKTFLQQFKTRIWVQHRPLWSSGHHGSDERAWQTWLVPKLEALQIDVMLAGHDHDYERFCPSLGFGTERHCDSKGIYYIVSGGGASMTVPLPNLAWKESVQSKLANHRQRIIFSDAPHYLTLHLQEQTLKIKACSSFYLSDVQCFDYINITLPHRE